MVYLGVDLGTSGLKLTIVDSDVSVVGEAEASYAVRSPRPGYAETDPQEWLDALHRAEADLVARLGDRRDTRVPAAIGVTGQMHGVVLTDTVGKSVRPAVLWPDQRTKQLRKSGLAMDVDARARLANPISPGMAGPVLTWLAEHEPETVGATALVRSPKDWLRANITGDSVTERSDASATLLWDVVADTWSGDACALAG